MTSLIKLQKKNNLPNIFSDFEGWIDDFFPFAANTANTSSLHLAGDLSEDEKNIYAVIEIPGIEKDNLKVSINDGILTISGEKKLEKEEKDKRFYRSECSYGEFKKNFSLPVEVEEDKTVAKYQNGVLKITLPKSQKAKSKQIKVEVA